MNVTLRLFDKMHPQSSFDWEMSNGNIFVTSYRDRGYSTKANAKRAAKHFAEKLGLTITQTEDTI